MTVTLHTGCHWDALTGEEQAAVRRLAKALRDWPLTLGIFGLAGTLCVDLLDIEEDLRGSIAEAASFSGVRGDGGDGGVYVGPVTRRTVKP